MMVGQPYVTKVGSPRRVPVKGWWNRPSTAVAVLTVSLVALGVRMWFPPSGIDLAVYRGAGVALLSGESPYHPSFATDFGGGLPFTYPPFAAVLSVALAYIPFTLLLITWTVASMVALWAGLRMWFPTRSRCFVMLALAASVWFTPVTDVLLLGQIGIFLVVGTYWDSVRVGKTAGALVGVLAAVKLVPGLFILYFLVTRQWRKFVISVASFLACTGVSFLVLPNDAVTYFRSLASATDRVTGDPGFYSNQSLLGLLARMNVSDAWAIAAAVALIVVLWAAFRMYSRGYAAPAVTMVGLGSCLISPITWQHHMVWLIPGMVYACSFGVSAYVGATVALFAAGVYLRFPQIGSHLSGAPAFIMTNWCTWFAVALAFILFVRYVRKPGPPTRLAREPGFSTLSPN